MTAAVSLLQPGVPPGESWDILRYTVVISFHRTVVAIHMSDQDLTSNRVLLRQSLNQTLECPVRDYLSHSLQLGRILTRIRTGQPKNCGWISQQGQKIFLFFKASRPPLVPNRTSYSMGTGGISKGVKQPGREADHLSRSVSEIKKTCSSTPSVFLPYTADAQNCLMLIYYK